MSDKERTVPEIISSIRDLFDDEYHDPCYVLSTVESMQDAPRQYKKKTGDPNFLIKFTEWKLALESLAKSTQDLSANPSQLQESHNGELVSSLSLCILNGFRRFYDREIKSSLDNINDPDNQRLQAMLFKQSKESARQWSINDAEIWLEKVAELKKIENDIKILAEKLGIPLIEPKGPDGLGGGSGKGGRGGR